MTKWLSRIDKDSKEDRNRRIFDRWLACWSNAENATAENVSAQTVDAIILENADLRSLGKSQIAASDHATDFDVPIYNVWNANRPEV